MTCPNCQAKITPKDNFCLRCGARLRPAESTVQSGAGAGDTHYGDAPAAPIRSEYVYGGFPSSDPIAGTDAGPPPGTPPDPLFAAPGVILPGPAPGSTPVLPPAGPYAGPAIFPTAAARTNRMIGVIAVAGAAMLLLLAVFAVTWVYTAGGTPTPPATQRSGATPASAQERAVIAAIEANNAAQIAALHSLDASELDGKMAGQALTDNQQMIQTLQQHGLYQDARLISIDYSRVQFQGANSATVNTVEQWSSTIYDRASGQVVSRQAPQTLHETYTLSLQNGTWVVQQVVILEDQGTPAPDQ
jgi:hypothetical protein